MKHENVNLSNKVISYIIRKTLQCANLVKFTIVFTPSTTSLLLYLDVTRVLDKVR